MSDKLAQNEIEGLEGTLENSQTSDVSILENILDMIPDGLFGGDNKTNQMHEIQENAQNSQLDPVSPKEPEDYTLYIKQVFERIMPAIIFHDEIMQAITRSIEKMPILPKVLDQLQEQLSMFVFSVMAPFVLPVIRQIRNELHTGSSEIIESSKREQHIVFEDDRSSDPTHSMLSKDHFSNVRFIAMCPRRRDSMVVLLTIAARFSMKLPGRRPVRWYTGWSPRSWMPGTMKT